MKKYILSWLASFLVIFNLGYVFHEIIALDFFKKNIGDITRENYIIPFVALSFVFYTVILTYLYPIFYAYYKSKFSPIATGAIFGALMGFLWDGLQGGLIEVATFKMPFIVFAVDSSYHVLEGVLAGIIIAAVYTKLAKKENS